MTRDEHARRLRILQTDFEAVINSFRQDITYIDALGALGAAIAYVVKRCDTTNAEREDLMLDFCTKLLNETLTGTAVLCKEAGRVPPPTAPTSSTKH